MKKIWLKVLSCFMAVNLMFMCFATSVFAANVQTFRLNGKNDGLDVVLNNLSTDDFRILDSICKKGVFNEDGSFKKEWLTDVELTEKFNKEIRSNYGNTVINVFRDTEYNPGYGKILLATAKKLDIPVADEITPYDVVNIEKVVIAKVVEKIRDNILKEEGGQEKWEKIESDALKHLEELFKKGQLSAEEYNNIKSMGIIGILGTAGGVGIITSLSGLLVYQIANSVFWAIANLLGITGMFTVPTVAPWIAFFISGLANPLVWIAELFVGVFLAGDTNWTKTIASVFFIAMKRQQIIAEQGK